MCETGVFVQGIQCVDQLMEEIKKLPRVRENAAVGVCKRGLRFPALLIYSVQTRPEIL